MLYQLHEFQKALLQPVSSWARAASEAFINASNPASMVPESERLAANYELLYRLGKKATRVWHSLSAGARSRSCYS